MPNTARPTPLRERLRQETRHEIRRIALALVEGRGYDGVTVDLISERAGVSVRTFFNYFPNKESAMIAIPPSIPESAVQEFLSHSGPQGLFVDLADLAVGMFAESGSAPSDFEASIQQGALLQRETEFVELIATRLSLAPDDEHPAVIAAAFTGAIRVSCQRWSRVTDRRTFAEEVRTCVRLLSTAVTDSPGGTVSPAARHR